MSRHPAKHELDCTRQERTRLEIPIGHELPPGNQHEPDDTPEDSNPP